MKSKKYYLPIAIFLLLTFILAGCGILPTPTKGVIEGRVLIPPTASGMTRDVSGWVPATGAEVTIVDADGVTHTVYTDEDGNYSFENIAVKPNTVVTATVEVDGKTIILKKVIPVAVAEDDNYDAGTMDPESTAIALVVEQLLSEGMDPGDIDLDEIKNTDTFTDLVEQVTTTIEEGKDVTEDPDVTDAVGETVEEIISTDDTPPSNGDEGGTTPSPKPKEYHTYKFNFVDLESEYVVTSALSEPTDSDFTGMNPVKLSIAIDQEKDKAYEGNVRVKPMAASELQLWAKDTSGNWHDINDVGWGPAEGFPIDTAAVTDVYVVPTAAFENQEITLELLDITADYGAIDDIIISSKVNITAVTPVFNGNVSGVINTSDTGVVTGTLTGDFNITISGQVSIYVDNIATFDGTVTGDIEGDISATINAQGIDTLYGTITGTDAVETVRTVGIFGQTGDAGDFAGEIITGAEKDPVTDLSISGEDIVALENTITLEANITPDTATKQVIWSVYVDDRDFAEIDEETGELTGLSAGTATVIVKTYDDSSLSFATKQITVVDGKVINVTQKLGYDTIQAAVDDANDDDVIEIAADTYTESILITDKSLSISGISRPILSGGIIAKATTAGKIIDVSAIDFQTSGLEVDGYDTVTIEGNTFTNIDTWSTEQYDDGSADAIYVHGSDTGSVDIEGNIITSVSSNATNIGDGMGITVLDLDNITINGNDISDTWHNSINIYQGIANSVTITGNTLSNWDSNMDNGGMTSGCEGGRALRIDLAGGASISITGNHFTPNNNTNPVDPDYVKITNCNTDITTLRSNIEGNNDWPDSVDYSTVLTVS